MVMSLGGVNTLFAIIFNLAATQAAPAGQNRHFSASKSHSTSSESSNKSFQFNTVHIRPPATHAQNGAALVLMLLALILFAGSMLIGRANNLAAKQRSEARTLQALQKARLALLAWSYARGVDGAVCKDQDKDQGVCNDRPGELPCPDTSAPGTPEYGSAEGSCAAGALGRLPWRTLGLGKIVDGDGEPLWYAVDGNFRWRWSSWNRVINSDTQASLQVYASDGATLITPSHARAAAVLFAPGSAQGNQQRDAGASTVASNYLEAALGRSNHSGGGPFIAGPVYASSGAPLVNDRLSVISSVELLDLASRRVARELERLLGGYAKAHGRYPHPAAHENPACQLGSPSMAVSACSPDTSRCRGRLPAAESLFAADSYPYWLNWNLWHQAVYYGSSANGLSPQGGACGGVQLGKGQRAGLIDTCHPSPASCPGGECTAPVGMLQSCSSTLILDGQPALALFVLPGASRSASPRLGSSILADYLDEADNQDGWDNSTPAAEADSYIRPWHPHNLFSSLE